MKVTPSPGLESNAQDPPPALPPPPSYPIPNPNLILNPNPDPGPNPTTKIASPGIRNPNCPLPYSPTCPHRVRATRASICFRICPSRVREGEGVLGDGRTASACSEESDGEAPSSEGGVTVTPTASPRGAGSNRAPPDRFGSRVELEFSAMPRAPENVIFGWSTPWSRSGGRGLSERWLGAGRSVGRGGGPDPSDLGGHWTPPEPKHFFLWHFHPGR